MTLHVDGAVVAAAAGAVGCLLVPALIARVPELEPLEPQPDGEDEDEDHRILREEGPIPLFAEIAAGRRLLVGAVLAGAVAGGLMGLSVGLEPVLVLLLVLVAPGVALGVVDWRTRLLPSYVVAPLYAVAVVGVLALWLVERDGDDLLRALYGWLFYGGLCLVMWFATPRSLGYGDVRLAGVLGIVLGYLGWGEVLFAYFVGFALVGVLGGLLVGLRVVHRRGVPAGPFLLAGAVIAVVVGSAAVSGFTHGLVT